MLLMNMQAVARKFNQLQRRETSTSLIDLRQPSSSFGKNTANKTAHRPSPRPRSSGGRITPSQTPSSIDSNNITCQTSVPARVQVALPCLAGATLQRSKDGGGFTAVRQPPLRAKKGLPSYTQVNEGFAKKRARERKLALNANTNNVPEQGAGVKEEFAVQIARRDDILQVG